MPGVVSDRPPAPRTTAAAGLFTSPAADPPAGVPGAGAPARRGRLALRHVDLGDLAGQRVGVAARATHRGRHLTGQVPAAPGDQLGGHRAAALAVAVYGVRDPRPLVQRVGEFRAQGQAVRVDLDRLRVGVRACRPGQQRSTVPGA
jgi:hypothetical protein